MLREELSISEMRSKIKQEALGFVKEDRVECKLAISPRCPLEAGSKTESVPIRSHFKFPTLKEQ